MGKKSVYVSMLVISALPLLILGMLVAVFSSLRIASTVYDEAESELRNLGVTIVTMYDELYPGDYQFSSAGKGLLLKGGRLINGDYEIIDRLKEELGVDITFFHKDTRIITTIRDRNGNRIVGTKANEEVVRDVLEMGEEHFYVGLPIGDNYYFAYYAPLFNEDGGPPVGMIFAAKPLGEIRNLIYQMVAPIVILTLAFMLIIGYASIRYSRKMVKGFKKIETFLYKVSKGDLTSTLDLSILVRRDEMGEMARHIVAMQNSFRELIEKDMLTGLNNRRCGDMELERIHKNAIENNYPFAVVLGDIDFFKKVNDTYGHAGGDTVLKSVASLLQKKMEGKGIVARWGGEEFLLVYENMDFRMVRQELEKLLHEIRETEIDYKGTNINITMTFGAVEGSGDKTHELLKAADDKLYLGKEHGRNCIVTDMEP